MKTKIAAIRKHAIANYDRGGWDNVVEAFDDDEIAEWLKQNNGNVRRTIAAIGEDLAHYEAYADEIRATAF